MARNPEGWRIRKAKGSDLYEVYFRANGKRVFRSCGTSDPEQAAVEAARIYAHHVQRVLPRRAARGRGDSPPLEDLVASWLEQDSTIAPSTAKVWVIYGRRWCALWSSLAHVTDVTCLQYRNDRLREVIADTVRKETGALRRFLAWCTDNGHLEREIKVPFVSKKATGTRFAVRRRASAPELSPDEAEALIAALPKWSTSKKVPRFPVQARFLVAYETGLRQSFLDVLSVPEHYRKGAKRIRVTLEADKNRFERFVPLTQRARDALDAVCPAKGLVFGSHSYKDHIRAAAQEVLPPESAAVFTGTHFRSARATHVLEQTGNVPGTMHLFGWKLVSTASKYTRASERAAEDVVRMLDEQDVPTKRRRA